MKKLLLLAIIAFSGCALLISCKFSVKNGDENPLEFDSVAAKKEVTAVNQMVSASVAKRDSVTAASCYTTDAKFMGSNEPAVVGRKNIQSLFSELTKAGITTLTVSTIDIWGNADLLAEEGTYTLAMKDGHPIDKGKYIVLWKKEDGKWKIFRDCSNSDLPAAASK